MRGKSVAFMLCMVFVFAMPGGIALPPADCTYSSCEWSGVFPDPNPQTSGGGNATQMGTGVIAGIGEVSWGMRSPATWSTASGKATLVTSSSGMAEVALAITQVGNSSCRAESRQNVSGEGGVRTLTVTLLKSSDIACTGVGSLAIRPRLVSSDPSTVAAIQLQSVTLSWTT